ncbi:MAG: hypothetical protein Pg6A_00090 [Termitinemataceae bacterium]|nr:MAG: hypothetical protein Pg6A_00090 [Termitinemataceae bacterium]
MLNRDLLVFQRPLLTFARSSNERMVVVSLCAFAAILQSAWFDRGWSLIVAAAALGGALVVDFFCAMRYRHFRFTDGSSIVTALLLTLFLPNTINPVFAALGTAFAVGVVKYSFGGLGANWFNPALGGWLFIRFSWPDSFKEAMSPSSLTFISNFIKDPAGSFVASPVYMLTKNGFGTQNGELITNFLNKNLFSLINIELPSAYFDFFINPGAGIIADRGVIALIAASMIMIVAMVSRNILSAIYLFVLLAIVRIAGGLPFGGEIGSGDMFFCLFSGGTLAVALFVIVESATCPKTKGGRLIFVIIAALLTWVFRYVKAEGCAAIFAVAAVNIISPLFRMIEEKLCYGGAKWQ